ncbi:hypothetical protein [Lacrimispora celerecrescens]|uniref:Uncharacterized protein n=1 Tax=[Clostridium] celerecrescens 18A TaxID=1286362 RepID=A0A2M8ZAP3_9FIRM|nr:hypothetical protein [Lacrimispora celerecrescens]PJJ30505.1 hypothetical protein H171_4111 [[Clostridium] celerecrescens 18A]
MEDGTIMVNVSLARYENGIRAMARIEALKAFAIKSDYNISREDIASILGFELPVEVEKDE